ncbi:unnamed protein product (macronuclear) [Paramecium tetraurelia]|uniref:Mini antigen n=1 Tax=Paramecium tetraurelia TaxID=5888 RepID=A0D6T4_PARTE|nr:uncharacterized protein GSPATT00001792001 [Paramecium tetraurelia]CAK78751.1 unnamed protein product [Paramecium tetraurelia]|eukprot:XP_001446148.1 hypothetical protein (macronuclear) [Paramecium tetraurelia strain d4-2]
MNYSTILLIGLVVSINGAITYKIGSEVCSCDTFSTSADCGQLASSCEWVSNECQDINCTTKTTIGDCNKNGCAFTTASKCEKKTSCANYKYDSTTGCNNIGCDAGTKGTDNLYPCKDFAATTSYIKDCGTYTAETDCAAASCKWSTKCVPKTCADLTQQTCTNIRGEVYTNRTLCTWDATKSVCADATTGLTKSQCLSYTFGTYSWNEDSSVCEECSSSYGELIITSVVLINLFL